MVSIVSMRVTDGEKAVQRRLLRVDEALDVQLENVGIASLRCHDGQSEHNQRIRLKQVTVASIPG